MLDLKTFSTGSKAMFSSPIATAAAGPRWVNDLMQCEVLRLWVAGGDRISQSRFRVPRKSYTEFFPEVYELAFLGEPAQSNAQWMTGNSKLVRLDIRDLLRCVGNKDSYYIIMLELYLISKCHLQR